MLKDRALLFCPVMLKRSAVGETMAQIASVRTSSADWLSVVVVRRSQLPLWLTKRLAVARAAAGDGRLGVVSVRAQGQGCGETIVCMSLGDFSAWFAPEVSGD